MAKRTPVNISAFRTDQQRTIEDLYDIIGELTTEDIVDRRVISLVSGRGGATTGSFSSASVDKLSIGEYIDLDQISPPADPSGNISRIYNVAEGGFSTLHYVNSSGVDFEISRDSVHIVRNSSGSAISKGDALYITGSNGVFPTVDKADASSASTMPFFGIAVQDISDNSFGEVVTEGDVSGVDTSSFNEGDTLFVDTTAGGLTTTEPTGDNIPQVVGTVIKANASGIIEVKQGTLYDLSKPNLNVSFSSISINGQNLFPDDDPQALGTGDSPTFAAGTFNGLLTISGVSPALKIIGTATGDSNLGMIEIYDSDGTTRRVFMGDGASGDDDLYLGADTGDIRFFASSRTIGKIDNTGFELYGSASGNSNIVTLEFIDSGSTRRGFIGDAASGNDDIYLGADTGEVRLAANGTALITRRSDTGIEVVNTLSVGGSLTTGSTLTVAGDADIQGNLGITGGLYANEFVVKQFRSIQEFVFSVANGRVDSVSGSAGSETITLKDPEGNTANPFLADDLVIIKVLDVDNAVLKDIRRKVSSISGLDVVLTDTGITWTAGTANDDVGSIEEGDFIVQFGSTSNTSRDHYIHADTAGLNIPAFRYYDGITDVDQFGDVTKEVFRTGGLDPGGSAEYDSSLSGAVGIAGKVSNNLAFSMTDSEGLLGGYNFDQTHLWTDGGSNGTYSGLIQRGSDTTKVFFAGGDDNDGANSLFYVQADGNIFHQSIGRTIYSLSKTGTNPDLTSGTFQETATVATSNGSTGNDTQTTTVLKATASKSFGEDKLVCYFFAREDNDAIVGTVGTMTNKVTVKAREVVSGTVVNANEIGLTGSFQEFTLELDISSLSDDKRFNLEIELYAEVDITDGDGSTYTARTTLREDVFAFLTTA